LGVFKKNYLDEFRTFYKGHLEVMQKIAVCNEPTMETEVILLN
jgi:hypothetical protein